MKIQKKKRKKERNEDPGPSKINRVKKKVKGRGIVEKYPFFKNLTFDQV